MEASPPREAAHRLSSFFPDCWPSSRAAGGGGGGGEEVSVAVWPPKRRPPSLDRVVADPFEAEGAAAAATAAAAAARPPLDATTPSRHTDATPTPGVRVRVVVGSNAALFGVPRRNKGFSETAASCAPPSPEEGWSSIDGSADAGTALAEAGNTSSAGGG